MRGEKTKRKMYKHRQVQYLGSDPEALEVAQYIDNVSDARGQRDGSDPPGQPPHTLCTTITT